MTDGSVEGLKVNLHQLLRAMIDKGADGIFGGGGKTGNGAVDAAAQRKVLAIGVDTDQYATLPEADAYLLTSAMKPIPGPLEDLIKLAKAGKFPTTGLYTGAAGYAPYHDVASQVPAKVDTEMQAVLKGLTDGSIKTNVPPVKPAAPAAPAAAPAKAGLSTTMMIVIVVIVLVLVAAALFIFRRKKK